MNEQTTQPVALITGASVRVGEGIARKLHAEGYNLILHYRNSRTAAESLATDLQIHRPGSVMLLSAHLDQEDSLSTMIQEVCNTKNLFGGRLDVLVNNASSFYPTPLAEATTDHWNELLNTNLKAPFLLTQGLAANLKASGGCIINLTDIHGSTPLENHSIYSLTKAGLISLTKSLAVELAPEIRTNGISPGAILWPEREANDTAYHQKILAQIPLGRLGDVANIAETVWYLVCNDYINGQIIAIDGGKSLT
jgi:pteridine reductase